jgi:hypothetical protein
MISWPVVVSPVNATGPRHDIEDAGREPRLERQLPHPQRRHRRVAGRLEDRGVAGSQRRRDLPAGHVHRVVPGHDQAADADRLLERHVEPGLRDRDGLAVDLAGGAGVVVEDEPDAGDLAPRAADRLARVAALQLGQVFGVPLDQLGQLREAAAALAGRPVRPALRVVERLARCLDRAIDVRLAAERRCCDDLAGRRVHDLEGLAVGGIDGLAADDHPERCRLAAGGAGGPLLDRHLGMYLSSGPRRGSCRAESGPENVPRSYAGSRLGQPRNKPAINASQRRCQTIP